MSKARKPKRKSQKRGPREERLVITGDPKTALDRLLKKPVSKS